MRCQSQLQHDDCELDLKLNASVFGGKGTAISECCSYLMEGSLRLRECDGGGLQNLLVSSYSHLTLHTRFPCLDGDLNDQPIIM